MQAAHASHHLTTSVAIETRRGAKLGTVAIVHLQQRRQHMQRHHGCATRFIHRCHFSCISTIVFPFVSHVNVRLRCHSYLNLYDSSSRPQDESMPFVLTKIAGSYPHEHLYGAGLMSPICSQARPSLNQTGRKAHSSLSRNVSSGTLKLCTA